MSEQDLGLARIPEHETWPPFSLTWNDTSSGPTDMSFLLEKPAGLAGFVQVVDGHLATGDGKRWRMWGVNICTDMPLPPTAHAPALARHLAKQGVNCVRLHAIDHRWPNGILMRSRSGSAANRWRGTQDETTREIDPEGLARLDYFVACCKAQGIYLDLNLNVARTFTEADGVTQAEQVAWGKALTYFDQQLIALQKEYAAQLVDHVNPFTGLRYGDEPAIALIELVNENSLIHAWVRGLLGGGESTPQTTHWYPVPSAYVAQLDVLWNARLCEQFGDRSTLEVAWEGDLAEYEDPQAGSVRRRTPDQFESSSSSRFQAEAGFYYGLECSYLEEMRAYLRDALGAKQLLLGTSDHSRGWSGLPLLAANARLDIMDGHFYWQHPRSGRPGVQWRRDDWYIDNSPMTDSPDASLIGQCSRSAVHGMPYIISECNEPFPNEYAAEFIPIAAAYGLLQDWDGLLFYDYDGSWGSAYWQGEEWRDPPKCEVFGLASDPVKWPQMAAGALTFLRGDVQAAREEVLRAVPHATMLDSLRTDTHSPYAIQGLQGRLALVHRTSLHSFKAGAVEPEVGQVALPKGRIASDTDELAWIEAPGDGHVLVDTPRHQAIIGRAGERATTNLQLALHTPFAAVQLSSLEHAPIATSSRMLLVVGGRVANTGMRWKDASHQTLGTEWGGPPARFEPVTGWLGLTRLEDAKTVRLQALDPSGQPAGPGRAFVSVDGVWRIKLTADGSSVWYLIDVRR